LNKVPVSEQALTASEEGMTPEQAIAGAGLAASADEIAKLASGSEMIEDQLNNVRSLVQQDPALVAQVVKNWTASDE
jgi:flagellar M-ring protein FliF